MRHYNGFWIKPEISQGARDTGCVYYRLLNDRMSSMTGTRFATEAEAISVIESGKLDHAQTSLTVANGTADGATTTGDL